MVTTEETLTYGNTGTPAFVEVRMGLGAAWEGSRHEGALYVVLDGSVPDGAYSDAEVDRMVSDGAMVEYGDLHEGNLPASELGLKAATELFLLGAREVDSAIAAGGHEGGVARSVRPLSAAFLGQPRPPQGADFCTLGRIWALVERARGLEPFVDLDAREVAGQVFLDVLSCERDPGAPPPEPRQLH